MPPNHQRNYDQNSCAPYGKFDQLFGSLHWPANLSQSGAERADCRQHPTGSCTSRRWARRPGRS
jgi:hypothetical protein